MAYKDCFLDHKCLFITLDFHTKYSTSLPEKNILISSNLTLNQNFMITFSFSSYAIFFWDQDLRSKIEVICLHSVEAQKCEPISSLFEGQRVLACSKLLQQVWLHTLT